MTNITIQRERAIKLAEKLMKVTGGDESLMRRVLAVRDRLKTPMSMVLDKVPGNSLTDRARRIGVTRQAYYAWLKGEYRPNHQQAKKLAQLTGFSIEDIRGRPNVD